MARVYVTPADVEQWAGEPVDADERAVARATRQVEEALRFARYGTTSAGFPRDPELRETLNEAVCAQTVHLVEQAEQDAKIAAGEMPPAGLTSASLGGASYTFTPAAVAAPGGAFPGALVELGDEAGSILRAAGLDFRPYVIG